MGPFEPAGGSAAGALGSAGWGMGNGWVLGVGGYAMRQFSDDQSAGVSLPGSRGQALQIGPSLKNDNAKGWFITATLKR